MTTLEVINHLYEAGLSVTLQPCGSLNLRPTKLVTPTLIDLVRNHKQDLIKYFIEKDCWRRLNLDSECRFFLDRGRAANIWLNGC